MQNVKAKYFKSLTVFSLRFRYIFLLIVNAKQVTENGYGLYMMSWGDKYQGGWKNGVMHGQGTYQFANGDKYIGTFKNGLRDGEGVYVRTNGNELVGLWQKINF